MIFKTIGKSSFGSTAQVEQKIQLREVCQL